MKLKITSIDHNGYNGREFHPEDRHLGLTVVVAKFETLFWDDRACGEPLVGDDGHVNADALLLAFGDDVAFGDSESFETIFTAVTKSGEVLQLMEHEVEVLVG